MPLVYYLGGLLTDNRGSLANSTNCCCGSRCCVTNLPLPRQNLTLTLESADCPGVDGTTITLVPTLPNDPETCWTATYSGVGGDPECYAGLYTLCCCNNHGNTCYSLCLTFTPSLTANCSITFEASPFLCTCEPMELLFLGEIVEVIPGFCFCCIGGGVVNARITE